VERRLKIVPHNTWKDLDQCTSSADFHIDPHNKYMKSASMPKIVDYPLHQSMNLIYKLIYRVRYELIVGRPEEKDFTIGYAMHLPTVSAHGDDIMEESVGLDLQIGPGATLFGEPLWDPQNAAISMKLTFLMNTSEDNVNDLQREDMIQKQLEDQRRKHE
jgi:hypothetical protein